MVRRLILAAALLAPVAALAHHGWGTFDRAQTVDLAGDVVSSSYVNPHGVVVLRDGGQALTFELAPVSRMQARGLAAEDIAPGRRVRLFAYRNTQDPNLLRAEWIQVGDRRVELR